MWQVLRSAIDQLIGAMHKYKEYLKTHNEHMKPITITSSIYSPMISPYGSWRKLESYEGKEACGQAHLI